MITLLTLTSAKYLLLIGMIAFFIYALFYQYMKYRKHRIDKFNEILTELLTLQKIKEDPEMLKSIMEKYAKEIGLKSE